MTNLELFLQRYKRNLREAVERHPDQYCWPLSDLDNVVTRMASAFLAGSYNKDGYAIRNTCRELGIPYTYSGINAYLNTRS